MRRTFDRRLRKVEALCPPTDPDPIGMAYQQRLERVRALARLRRDAVVGPAVERQLAGVREMLQRVRARLAAEANP